MSYRITSRSRAFTAAPPAIFASFRHQDLPSMKSKGITNPSAAILRRVRSGSAIWACSVQNASTWGAVRAMMIWLSCIWQWKQVKLKWNSIYGNIFCAQTKMCCFISLLATISPTMISANFSPRGITIIFFLNFARSDIFAISDVWFTGESIPCFVRFNPRVPPWALHRVIWIGGILLARLGTRERMICGSCLPLRMMMQRDHGDGDGIPCILPSPTQSKCRLQVLHGNEVY